MTTTAPPPSAPDPPADPPIDPPVDPPVDRAFARMRLVATGALVVMTAVFVSTYVWGGDRGVWGYVRAFAEAAMVGGLADWFAVTAIFRRPLGLPIPHTAVIPKNQARIAETVGKFISTNFLDPDLLERRLADQPMAQTFGRWLAEPDQARTIASGLTDALPGLLDALDDEHIAGLLRRQFRDAESGAPLAPILGSVLEALAAQGVHQRLLDAALDEGFRLLSENQSLIRSKVRERSGWLTRLVDGDKKVSDSIIEAVEILLAEISVDQRHPVRLRASALIEEFSRDLRDSPQLQARVGGMVRDALAHESVGGAVAVGWGALKDAIRRDCAAPESAIRAWVEDALSGLARGLIDDASVQTALDHRLRALIVSLARRHGPDVAGLVADTIRSWDARTLVEKLESGVGRDLQYIRLNGTIIGGLIGLVLHAGGVLLGGHS
ncbi:DUF445 family protein [bacterium]|nr:DUF445 family protein [bacterium]